MGRTLTSEALAGDPLCLPATQSCPDGARDFRAEQCAELDGASFHGRQYRWLPYYGGERSAIVARPRPRGGGQVGVFTASPPGRVFSNLW